MGRSQKSLSPSTATPPLGMLKRALKAAQYKFMKNPNIVGVGVGTKLKRGKATREHNSIQFFVVRKRSLSSITGPVLPKFVYGRRPNGQVDRRYRIPTDVIKVGRIRATCGAGSAIETLGKEGAIALLFTNKAAAGGSFLVSCAHVLSDLRVSVPVVDELFSNCRPAQQPFARTVASATAKNGVLQFDVALGQLVAALPPSEDLVVETAPVRHLERFFPSEEIKAPLLCDCALPASNIPSASVMSFSGAAQVSYPQGDFVVKNAYVIAASVRPGDSGGLLFVENSALGIVFARSDEGFAWFHALEPAIDYLEQRYGAPLQCFP
jgi:hypothetical protein